MVFWPAVRSVVKSRLRTSPDIAANLSVSLFGSSRLCPPCLVALLFGACVLTTAAASKWCLIIVQCCLSPYFRCSIVNIPAVRWSPLLLSQPEDKDTQVQVNGQLPCVFSTDSWVNSGTLHIQSGMRSLLEIVRSQVGLPDGSARDNALNRRTLTVNKQKPKPSMPQEPHFCLAGQPPLP